MQQLDLLSHRGASPSQLPTAADLKVEPPSAQVDESCELGASASQAAPGRSAMVSPRQLGLWLQNQLGRPLRLTVTDNRSTVLSCRTRGGVMQLRLHQMFLGAPANIWYALVAYLGADSREAGRVLDAFVAAQPPHPPPPRLLRTKGRVYDLTEIFNHLNTTYFHGACRAQITWGAASRRRRRRSIQLGCYLPNEQLIRIHPCLDQSFVPRAYLSWVIFHEMLHEVLGVEQHGSRRSVHPPEFVALEQTYPDYAVCQAWEEQNISRLLSYRPPSNPRRG